MEGGQKIIIPKGKIHNVSSKIQNYQISLAIILLYLFKGDLSFIH